MTEVSLGESKIPTFDPEQFNQARRLYTEYLKIVRKSPDEKTQNEALGKFLKSTPTLEVALYQDRTFGQTSEMINRVISTKHAQPQLLDIIEKHILRIDQKLKQKNQYALGLATNLIEYGSPTQQHLGLTVLGQRLDYLGRIFFGVRDKHGYLIPALISIVCFPGYEDAPDADKYIINAARKMTLEAFKTKDIDKGTVANKGDFLAAGIRYKSPQFIEDEALPTALNLWFGLPNTTAKEWRKGNWQVGLGRNLSALTELERSAIESRQPAISAFLNREFGIFDFGRYPTSLLVQQFREYNNSQLPYGVILYPRHDHNGAFYGDLFVLMQLQEQLAGKYLIRVVEAEDKIDIARWFRKLDKKYGEHQKISFLIIGGHGEKDSIQFGSGKRERDRLSIQNLTDPRMLGVEKYFVEHPTLILYSCSTGSEGGIAQKLSETLGITVIAPNRPTSPRSIKTEDVNGRLRFTVEYHEPQSTRSFTSGQKASG